MTYITISLMGRAPQSADANTLGEAAEQLGIDTDNVTFRANGAAVGLDFAPSEPVTVVGAKNLVGA